MQAKGCRPRGAFRNSSDRASRYQRTADANTEADAITNIYVVYKIYFSAKENFNVAIQELPDAYES